MIDLYIMVGVPGCGKSTWIENNRGSYSTVISRDEIRFNMLKSGDDYFKYETKVFHEYVNQINNAINYPCDIDEIYCDATQINEKSRNKILDRLDLKNIILEAVYFDLPAKVVSARNNKRIGRYRVPEETMQQMADRLTCPSADKKYNYKAIRVVTQ